MWPFKKQAVSEEIQAIANHIDENPHKWVYKGSELTNTETGASLRYTGSIGILQFSSTGWCTINRAEKELLKISIDKCIAKNAIRRE